jgi:hypothetical protein
LARAFWAGVMDYQSLGPWFESKRAHSELAAQHDLLTEFDVLKNVVEQPLEQHCTQIGPLLKTTLAAPLTGAAMFSPSYIPS